MGLLGGLLVTAGGLIWLFTGYHYSKYMMSHTVHRILFPFGSILIVAGFALMLMDLYLQARAGHIV